MRREEAVVPNVIIQQLPKTPEAKRELVKRITDAFVDAYKSPPESVHVWIDEFPADGYAIAGKLIQDK
jgi:4-oxalocrotonate tautomerase